MPHKMSRAGELRYWIEAVLANDENSTDDELIAYLVKEAPMSEQAARNLVSMRGDYLREDRGR